MKMPGLDSAGKFDRIPYAIYVDGGLAIFIRAQVVDSRKVLEMADLALEFLDVLVADAQLRRSQVTVHSDGACRRHSPELAKRSNLACTFRPNQKVNNRAFSLQEFLNQTLANEAGSARHEILRCCHVVGLAVKTAGLVLR